MMKIEKIVQLLDANILCDHQIIAFLKDEGPGISDLDRAMLEGFSTASPKVREMGFGAGMGLPNMKKNGEKNDLTQIVTK